MNTNLKSKKEAHDFIVGLTTSECDRIALDDGCMSIQVRAEDRPFALTDVRRIDGWALHWIPKDHKRSVWSLILTGRTPRTAELARYGRASRISREYDVPLLEAERYDGAVRGIPFGFEDVVIKSVFDAHNHPEAWESFPGPNHCIPYWVKRHPQFRGVQHNRLVSINKLVKILQGKPEVCPLGIELIAEFNKQHIHKVDMPEKAPCVSSAWG